MAKQTIHRVRRTKSDGNGSSIRVHHMDLWAESEEDAMKKAKTNKKLRWRWIDRFDSAEEKFETYEYLGEGQAKNLHKTYGY